MYEYESLNVKLLLLTSLHNSSITASHTTFFLQRAFLTSRNTTVVTAAIQCVTNAQNFAMANVTARAKTTVISALT